MKNKNLRPAGFAAAALAAVLAPSRCGSTSAASTTENNPYGLIQPGTIRVASLGDSKPYTFADASGNFTGFDVELFKDVAHRAARLYRFDRKKYQQLQKRGFNFEI